MPKRPLRLEGATFYDLLRSDSPRAHTTGGGLHANRGGSRGDDLPERPPAVRLIDGDRTDERAWAGPSGGCAIVDLIRRSEAAGRSPAVDAFNPQLTRGPDLFGSLHAHCIRGGRRRRRCYSGHDLTHRRGGATEEIVVPAVDSRQRMSPRCQRGRDQRRDTIGQRDRQTKVGQAVLELYGSGRHSGGRRRRAHRCSQRDRLSRRGRVRCGGQSGGSCRLDEDLPGDREEVRLDDTDAWPAEAEEIVLTTDDAVVDRRMADESRRRRRRGVPPQKRPDVGLNKREVEGTRGRSGAAATVVGEIDGAGGLGNETLLPVRTGHDVRGAGLETAGDPEAEGGRAEL